MEHSFEIDLTWGTKIQELDLIRKKRQALDQLLASERISKSTFEYLGKKLAEETTNLEAQLKSLSDSMTTRAQELETKIGQLEVSLANLEMYHVTGEIDDKTYETHNKTILLGLEAAKQEMENVRDSLLNALSGAAATIEEPPKIEEKEEAEDIVKPQEPEEKEILETTMTECKPTCETVESTEPIEEATIETIPDESVQTEVPPIEACSGESEAPVEKTETASE